MQAIHATLSAALRAMQPFQFEPTAQQGESVLLMQISRQRAQIEAQAAKLKEQGARIDALQASVIHELAKGEKKDELMKQATEAAASLRARLTAKMPSYIDVVRAVFIDGDEFLCGFIHDGASLHCEAMFAIGAVDVGSFDSDCMARMAERDAERQLEQERCDAAYNRGADRHEFKLAFGD